MASSTKPAFAAPSLPWAKDALAKKGISVETIEYHYGKHHLGYVRKLNEFAAKDSKIANSTLEYLICNASVNTTQKANNNKKKLNSKLIKKNKKRVEFLIWLAKFGITRFIGTGYVIFFYCFVFVLFIFNRIFTFFLLLLPLFTRIDIYSFKKKRVWLAKDVKKNKLVIIDGHDAVNPLREGFTPLLTIDVWEHAYYIDHRNDRGAYVTVWWDCVNWDFEERKKVYFRGKKCLSLNSKRPLKGRNMRRKEEKK
ncbi:iron-dependent superoxide dismutase [Reticulomyxa filosa]|uniref:Superoxide dismutase n=1 Tax=Reticulomyxa filosa TaxID=46433 RepID=X6NPX0_RETFI|nr:iron-dependent superoxide dismutase [Reticulomyxa filosa]|eukprot:ETO27759.1 iron-dependent superoxide dismutase [Reticulomyxa filosa]